MSRSAISEALGLKNMWGFSPVFNLISAIAINTNSNSMSNQHNLQNAPINILLLSPCDIRHIIQILSDQSASSSAVRPVHFYLMESHVEGLAKDLFLLHLFLNSSIPTRQRAILFLEIYGNALVQEKTEVFIEYMGNLLASWINDDLDDDCPIDSAFYDMVDVSFLKYRERDDIGLVFRSWSRSIEFDVIKLREYRMRHYYAERYDCRRNVVDWDYHSKVRDVASIIHLRQYRDWRLKGIAYEYGETVYSKPNRTCSSQLEGMMKSGIHQGTKQQISGYWLDIVVSPYTALGIDCDRTRPFANDLFDVINQGTGDAQQRHHAAEIATYNIVAMMFASQIGRSYELRCRGEIYSGLGKETDGSEDNEHDLINNSSHNKSQVTTSMPNRTSKIFPVVGSSGIKRLMHGEMNRLLKQGADVYVESPKYLFPLDSKCREEIENRIFEMADNLRYNRIDTEELNPGFYHFRS